MRQEVVFSHMHGAAKKNVVTVCFTVYTCVVIFNLTFTNTSIQQSRSELK